MILNVSVKNIVIASWLASLTMMLSISVQAAEWSGYAGVEDRYFLHDSPFSNAAQNHLSLVLAPEFYHEWDDGEQSLIIAPFLRIDTEDTERTHADFREFQWLLTQDDWELRLGLAKVFWGVTESQHLVDVINQTDLVENSDGEDKLGQAMVNLSFFRDWGTVDLFVLPYFRERTFTGVDGRLRSALIVDTNNATYESSRGRQHIDVAFRWSHAIGDWDVGVSHFYGTNREPLLTINTELTALIPHYQLMHQTGLDIQNTSESWLWKLEMIRRETQSETYTAVTGGFEYTFYGVFESDIDIGLIAEYLFDDRDNELAAPFEDDVLVGTRITWNDEQSTELLLGMIQDMDSSDASWNIEASRRIGDRWKISAEARLFSVNKQDSALYSFRNDDYFQLELARYF